MKVLTVCTGNICRSPFAAEYLRKRAGELGLNWQVASAGTMALAGNRALDDAIWAAGEFSVDLTQHAATMLTRAQLMEADLVLPMTMEHARAIYAMLGRGAQTKIELLGRFHPQNLNPPDIADPIGGGLDVYRECYRMIQEAVDGLIGKRL